MEAPLEAAAGLLPPGVTNRLDFESPGGLLGCEKNPPPPEFAGGGFEAAGPPPGVKFLKRPPVAGSLAPAGFGCALVLFPNNELLGAG